MHFGLLLCSGVGARQFGAQFVCTKISNPSYLAPMLGLGNCRLLFMPIRGLFIMIRNLQDGTLPQRRADNL